MAERSLRILVIEDDEDARNNLSDILELDDHIVDLAGSKAEALKDRDWPAYAAIILDRKLPDAGSEELLPRLRTLAPEAAVVIVTGYADIQGAIAALRQGATDYILKPINPDDLRATLVRIVERRRLAMEKARSEAAFRHLVEAAECLIVILREDGSIVYLNPFVERTTGHPLPEAEGTNYLDLLVEPADRASVAAEIDRILSKRPTPGFEYRVRSRLGQPLSVVWTARLLDDYEDRRAILKIGQDITDLKLAQERMLQNERLAAIGQMVTGLAHESRNALQRSQACLEMLTLVVTDRPEALNLIERLQKAQDHLHYLYEDVRSYAAPIQLKPQACDVRDIWRETWAHIEKDRKSKEAELVEEIATGDLACVVDAFRLTQVFRNLLDNAIAAGKAPVIVTIRAEDDILDRHPAIRLTVRDNGPGLDPEAARRVFDPFYTTKAKGTGLGLAITRRIIEAHQGKISVAASESPGATFQIVLPRGTAR